MSGTEFEDFEYLKIPIPRHYEDLLTSEYGNWHQFIRGPEGGARHDWMRYDTDRNYRTVLMEEFGYRPDEISRSIP